MGLLQIRASFECDKCGLEFSVEIDNCMSTEFSDTAQHLAKTALRDSKGYCDGLVPSVHRRAAYRPGGAVLCGVCTHEVEGELDS